MPFSSNPHPQSVNELNVPILHQQLLSRITTQINRSLELAEILTTTVAEVRDFLATDRVKIYQFQPDGHGLVIAEALDLERLPSLLDLHFPADDIPVYARELYLRARIRTVVNLETQTIDIVPIDPAQTDDPSQRALDPCHVEYLRAMGVKSSIVVPIVIESTLSKPDRRLSSLPPDRDLWGLLVCHHREPRVVDRSDLALLQLVVDRLSISITQSRLLQQVREQAKQEAALNRIVSLLYATSTVELQAALDATIEIFQGVGGRLYLPQHRTADRPIQNSKQCAVLYSSGTQPSPPDERYLEENLLWQKYLMSVCSPADRHRTGLST